MAQVDYLLRDATALSNSRVKLKTAALPQEQRAAAKVWLETLDHSDRRSVFSFDGDFGVGRTSNANFGTTGSDFLGAAIPNFYRPQASNFVETALGIVAARAVGSFQDLLASARFFHRAYSDVPSANQTVVAASLTYQRPMRGWITELSALGFDERVGGVPQRKFGALEFLASRRVTDFWEISAIARAGRLNYRIANRPDFDVWRALWNVNASRLFGNSLTDHVGIGLYGGGDSSVIRESAYGNARLGLRTFADAQLNPQFAVSAEATFSAMQFDQGGTFAGANRKDQQGAVVASGIWKWDPASRWALQLRVLHQRVNSNVPVFLFSQNEIGLFIKLQDK